MRLESTVMIEVELILIDEFVQIRFKNIIKNVNRIFDMSKLKKEIVSICGRKDTSVSLLSK